jgi:hypothetical protein
MTQLELAIQIVRTGLEAEREKLRRSRTGEAELFCQQKIDELTLAAQALTRYQILAA